MGVPLGACLQCGEELKYLERPEEWECDRCGRSYLTNVCCAQGHYICDRCHSEEALKVTWSVIKDCPSCNPIEVMDILMDRPEVHMHGPEHHALVPVALLTAYANAGGVLDSRRDAVREILRRGEQVPGGICGFWGSCGAAIGSGIFLSVALKGSPLKKEHYGNLNRITAQCLEHIARVGGPRCCKRNSYICIMEAGRFTQDVTGVVMELPDSIMCHHKVRNKECIKQDCPFY